ncbi:MAG: glycosyltransferase [Chlamydiae bacterium]|nr:glycosyltransferase [Chlamydiota bacterium]
MVKEADLLVDMGYRVRVICAHWISWADQCDKLLLKGKGWTCLYVGGHPVTDKFHYHFTRVRQRFARSFLRRGVYFSKNLRKKALSRVSSELERAAINCRADLYIAHTLGALPAAVAAARKNNVFVGFDAEDFHSGENLESSQQENVKYIENHYLRECDYVTASSQEIADMYKNKYKIPAPISVLNVFPLLQRPSGLRPLSLTSPLTLYWFSQTIGANRGLEDVVRAMGVLKNLKIELHLRGLWAAGYQKQFFELVNSVGLNIKQILIHDPSSPDDMVRLAAKYDIGLALEQPISLNRELCLTNKIFVYLLAGNAIIATATKAQRTLIDTIKPAAICYEAGDIKSLVHGIERWCKNRSLLEQARRQSWDYGSFKYNWDLEKVKLKKIISQFTEE